MKLCSVCVLLLFRAVSCIDQDLITDVLQAIDSAVDFIDVNAEDVYADLLFGVAMAKGQLSTSRNNLEKKLYSKKISLKTWRPIIEEIHRLEEKCGRVLNVTQNSIILTNDEVYNKMVYEFLRPDRWSRLASPKRIHKPSHYPGNDLATDTVVLSAGDTAATVASLTAALYQGTPDEETSNACLAEAMAGVDAPACVASERCACAEMGPQRSRGYPLTHRLLYAQVATQSGCEFLNSKKIDDIVNNFCSDILMDAQLIEILEFPDYARDLFCEQVAVCGFEGFREFVKAKWIRKILGWQRPIGCFGDKTLFESMGLWGSERSRRRKRSEGVMAFDCSMHFTGVATAALAVSVPSLLGLNGE